MSALEQQAALVNALPYVDRGFDEAGVREAALGMVEEEMRRYRPTKNYLEHLPPLNLHQFETDILRAEFERLSSRQPPEHMSMKRYELPAPPTGRLTDVQSWRDSVDNSRAQLEHQSVRIENLQLLLAHGSDAWRCHNDTLVRMVAETERRLQATRKAVKEVNLQRKTEQVQAGERLHTLEDTWVHLVMKNYELEREIADLETAVSKAEAERPLPQTEKSTEPEAARVETAEATEAAEASDDNDELPPTPPARQSPVPTPPPPALLLLNLIMASNEADGSVRCFYDILQVDRQASQAEIRTAYHRQALRWHPDKQQNRADADSTTAEDTTDQFRQIQRAYEILGDPRTRALYDQHREAILRQRDTQWEPETDSTNPFNYFPPGCYSNYGDGPGGFFDVYGRLFDKLAGELNLTLPEFGKSNSDYKSVVAEFYSAWEASLTQLSSQQQQQHRRCEELRVLLAFVKAWDPRVFNWRVQAASQLITGLAEEVLQASVSRSVLAGLAVGGGALLGGALLPRVGNFGLAFGAACAAVAYAVANRGGFVSLADAIRSMPPEKRTRLAELTADAMRDMNAMDSATWASLIATDAQFRARLLQLARRFAYGQQTADEEADEAREAELPIGTPAAASMTSVEQQHQRAGGVRCYYELLEVERQATDDELKKAYRRLALRWHPDKNPDRVEEATAHFRLVQKAYETLSDPQERAWYDKHRERILKGGLGRGDAYQEERLDVFQFFTSACYDDYDDGEEGYFTVYARVFSDLAEEERRACDGDDEPPPDFPEFGRSDSPYDTVVRPFYAHWETFFTRKSYVWVEKYDTREAPNKYARKAMEKENRAARDAARRERNEEIRTLVAFVKKRDPRVRAERRRLEARAREVEAKAKAMASAARKAHLETASRYRAPDWARTDDLEAELAKIEAEHGAGASDLDDDGDWEDQEDGGEEGAGVINGAVGAAECDEAEEADEDDAEDALVCVVCEKAFRTPGAKQSHDRSKRHRERLELLKLELAKHDAQPVEKDPAAADNDSLDNDEDVQLEAEVQQVSGGKKKKSKRKQQQRQQLQAQLGENEEPSDNPNANSAAAKPAEDAAEASDDEAAAAVTPETSKKPRRRKDRQRQKQQELLEQKRQEQLEEEADGTTQVCKTYRQWFDSKNQLFKHLKESGHAAIKPGAAAGRTDGKKSKRK
uniref:DnaJ homolog subfamily C member 21 n=2 Tax=Macrostomum lignano TaxID=282301 RepID=A0A1I8H8V6_9PLAT